MQLRGVGAPYAPYPLCGHGIYYSAVGLGSAITPGVMKTGCVSYCNLNPKPQTRGASREEYRGQDLSEIECK